MFYQMLSESPAPTDWSKIMEVVVQQHLEEPLMFQKLSLAPFIVLFYLISPADMEDVFET